MMLALFWHQVTLEERAVTASVMECGVEKQMESGVIHNYDCAGRGPVGNLNLRENYSTLISVTAKQAVSTTAGSDVAPYLEHKDCGVDTEHGSAVDIDLVLNHLETTLNTTAVRAHRYHRFIKTVTL